MIGRQYVFERQICRCHLRLHFDVRVFLNSSYDPAHSHDPRRRPATLSAIISFKTLIMTPSIVRYKIIANHKPDGAFSHEDSKGKGTDP